MFSAWKCVFSLCLAVSVNAFSTTSTTSTKLAIRSNQLTSRQLQRQGKSTTKSLQSTLSQVENNDNDTVVYEQLSLPARNGRPLKVAIAGGGVGGLTTALCLLKKGIDVTVYEKTAAFARFGGPIQFASNALSVLKEIDDTLFNRIMEKFTFTGTRTCGIKDGLRADGSFRMTNDSLDYLWNPDAPADWFVKFPLKVCKLVYASMCRLIKDYTTCILT
jgi:NAD(P)-binding Rossmann-like domain